MRIPYRTMTMAAAALAVAAVPGSFDLLVLDRHQLLDGQAWRLFTGHLVHASRYHLALNVIAMILLGIRFEPALGRRFWAVLTGSAALVSLGVMAFDPTLDSYCGLSGILNGLWVAGALAAASRERLEGNKALAVLYQYCVIAGLAKIGVEALSGAPVFTDIGRLGALPVPLAHALGALAGAVLRTFPGTGTLSLHGKCDNVHGENGTERCERILDAQRNTKIEIGGRRFEPSKSSAARPEGIGRPRFPEPGPA